MSNYDPHVYKITVMPFSKAEATQIGYFLRAYLKDKSIEVEAVQEPA